MLSQLTGEYGRAQTLLRVYLWVVVAPVTALVIQGNLLLVLIPQHWCHVPALANLSLEDRRRLSVPQKDEGGFDSCRMYDTDYSDVLAHGAVEPDAGWNVTTCRHGWEYDFSIIYPTIVTELNWVCNDAWKAYFCHTIYWCSSSVGSLIFGYFSGTLGRVPVIFSAFVICAVGGLVTNFANTFETFALTRAIVGFTAQAASLPAYVVVMEYMPPTSRIQTSTIYHLIFPSFNMVLQWVAFYLHDWRMLNWIMTFPAVPAAIITIFMPESLRWLQTKGKTERVKKTVAKIYRMNGKPLNPELLASIKSLPQESSRQTLWTMLCRPKLRRVFVILNLMWVFVSMSNMTSNMYASMVWPNPFLMTTFNRVGDLIANILARLMSVCLGRQPLIVIFCVAGSFFAFLFNFLPPEWFYVQVVVLVLTRLSTTGCNNINNLYGTELLPTVVRSEASFMRLAIGSLGFLLSPQVVYLHHWGRALPFLLAGCFMSLAALLALPLPETKDRKLPDSLEDGERFVDSHVCCACLRSSAKKETPEIYVITRM